jgi:amidohydrolase
MSAGALLDAARRLYVDVHRRPELSGQERRTALRLADWLAAEDYTVTTGVGGHGVVGLLHNGDGPTVMLRTEMDALPVREQTGLPYASTATSIDGQGRSVPVMHACGHDLHLAAVAGAASLLARNRGDWRGTVMVVGQPAEETLAGAAAMLGDGLFDRFARPDVVLAQHLAPMPAGLVAHPSGALMAASLTLRVVVHGRGGHAAAPHLAVDPIPTVAAIVMRMQGVVARETAPAEPAVLSVGALHAGEAAGVLPDRATLEVTLRALSDVTLARLHSSVRRIVAGEAAASGCPVPPDVVELARSSVLTPDEAVAGAVLKAHRAQLGVQRVTGCAPIMAAEDAGRFAEAGSVPLVYWLLGAAGRDDSSPPEPNHSPRFAPAVGAALATGISAMVSAATSRLRSAP